MRVSAGSNGAHDMAKLEAFVEECSELPAMQDAVIAQDSQQTQNIWKIREGIPEGVIKQGKPLCCLAPLLVRQPWRCLMRNLQHTTC